MATLTKDEKLLARLTAPARERTAPAGELVTAEIVAERFHLAVSSVHELARMGRIPCRMFGRFRRFDLAEVAAAGLDWTKCAIAAWAAFDDETKQGVGNLSAQFVELVASIFTQTEQRAVAVLRGRGWTCTPPREKAPPRRKQRGAK
jgi:hypothetical protein